MGFEMIPETLVKGADVVEVKCPVCGGDILTPLEGRQYECCICGMIFETHYRLTLLEALSKIAWWRRKK